MIQYVTHKIYDTICNPENIRYNMQPRIYTIQYATQNIYDIICNPENIRYNM
jgi:hypothetical protein